MSNPWLKKNPFMSMWLSGAHSIANAAHGQIAAVVKRESTAALNQATQDAFILWTGVMIGKPTPKPRRKRRK